MEIQGVKYYPLESGNSFIHTYKQEDSKHELETLEHRNRNT